MERSYCRQECFVAVETWDFAVDMQRSVIHTGCTGCAASGDDERVHKASLVYSMGVLDVTAHLFPELCRGAGARLCYRMMVGGEGWSSKTPSVAFARSRTALRAHLDKRALHFVAPRVYEHPDYSEV
jgi:hypothetical protein